MRANGHFLILLLFSKERVRGTDRRTTGTLTSDGRRGRRQQIERHRWTDRETDERTSERASERTNGLPDKPTGSQSRQIRPTDQASERQTPPGKQTDRGAARRSLPAAKKRVGTNSGGRGCGCGGGGGGTSGDISQLLKLFNDLSQPSLPFNETRLRPSGAAARLNGRPADRPVSQPMSSGDGPSLLCRPLRNAGDISTLFFHFI